MTGLPACHGIRVMPSRRLPSVRDRPVGSLVTGMPAEVKSVATKCDVVGLCPGHACTRSHEGQGHQPGHHNHIHVEYKDQGPYAIRLLSAPLCRQVSDHKSRLKEQITGHHWEVQRLPEMRLADKNFKTMTHLIRHQVDPTMTVSKVKDLVTDGWPQSRIFL